MSDESSGQRTLHFDQAVYRLSAIKKASYRFGDRCFVHISQSGAGTVQVCLTAKRDGDPVNVLVGEFENEVLDQELREVIADETRPIRDLLLAQAFSGVSLTDSPGETGDFRADPLGISQSQAKTN